jgi:hypothetical protein
MKKVIGIINKLLLYGLFVFGIVLIIFYSNKTTSSITALTAFFESILFIWVLRLRGINDKYWLYINIGLWLNVLGEILIYWSGPQIYDKVLHLYLGIVITAIVYEDYKINMKINKMWIFLSLVGLLGVWEIYEYILDNLLHFNLQGVIRGGVFTMSQIDDTMYDLIIGALGSIGYLFLKKEKVGENLKKGFKKAREKIRKIKEREVENAKIRFLPFIKSMFRFK